MNDQSPTAPDTVTVAGTGVVPGVAYAPAAWKQDRPQTIAQSAPVPEDGRDAEVERLTEAVGAVADRLEARASTATGVASEVLAATAALARDRGWIKAATKLVRSGTPAPEAVIAAIAQFIATFEKLGGLMAERTTDLRDIRDRVVAQLMGLPEPGVPTPDHPVVLLADDLAPADTATLDPQLVVALVTELGGPTSHTAIISRQLGIPCVVAATGLRAVADGVDVLVDGTTGTVSTGLDPREARERVADDAGRRAAVRDWRGPARTRDGREVELLANVQDGAGARVAADSEARGVGLFRTELCFLNSDREPDVATQAAVYGEVFEAFAGRKVVVRTLDAGSDKPLRFATAPDEENPALGVRGIRTAGRDEGLLTRQLDGIAAAAGLPAVAGLPAAGRAEAPPAEAPTQAGRAEAPPAEAPTQAGPWVMAPMVATIPEAEWFAALCRQRGLVPGIMVEVPSVALLAERFLAHVDFLSIGTNDLSQYTMAADLLSPQLAALTDPWQPAVLALIEMTARAGRDAGKPVGVCGEAAADPHLACVLVGLGVTSLSMAASAVAGVGVQLGEVDVAACERAARAALAATDAAAAKQAALDVLAAG